jgi:hypothetical protein
MTPRRFSEQPKALLANLEHEGRGGSDSSYACPLGRSLPRVGPSSSLQMPDNLFEQSMRLGNLNHLFSSVLARLGFIR